MKFTPEQVAAIENAPGEWAQQYLCEPQPPLPPGEYCYFCSHDGRPYWSDMCGKRDCRVEHPGCPERDCACIAHMTKILTVK